MKPQYVGKVNLSQSTLLACEFHLVKQNNKNREKRNLIGKKVRCSSSLKHAKRESEPWLLATSLSSAEYNSNEIINMYRKRMQIEQTFRDLKNTRNGFCLRHCRSYQADRLNIALLIASLAMVILWLVGKIAIQRKLHFSYQTNTEKKEKVLSIVFIGWQTLMRKEHKFNLTKLKSQLLSAVSDERKSL